MRQPRLKAPKNLDVAYYHCVSRAVERSLVFDDVAKNQFVEFMRLYEKLCHLRVVTYCVMPNHMHLLVEVPARPKSGPSEKALLEHITECHGEKYARSVQENLRRLRSTGQRKEATELLDRWKERLWDISSFMKTFKQRFTQWYNKTQNRRGTLWEERYRSTLVEGGGIALAMVGAYIDLNPMRAKLVRDVKRYSWCGYGAAMAGDKLAQKGIETLVSTSGKALRGAKALDKYREFMAGHLDPKAGAKKAATAAKASQGKSTKKRSIAKKAASGLSLGEALRHRVRYFSSGAVIGTPDFVNKIFTVERDRFSSRRKVGAKPMKGADFAGLCTLRTLRRDVIE